MDENLLIQVRDLLGYSWETYPITNEEISIINKREKEKRLAELQAKMAEKQARWDSLTPEEQKFELRTRFVRRLLGMAIATVLVIGGFFLWQDSQPHPYPKEGCPINHFWDEDNGVCKKYYNLD
jgi:hypothetical protein